MPLHLKADVKVSVLSGEGKGARVSVNMSWVLFHPGVRLLVLQGGESWVLALSTAPCDGCSTCALVLAGRPSTAAGPLSESPCPCSGNAISTLTAKPGTPCRGLVLLQPLSS